MASLLKRAISLALNFGLFSQLAIAASKRHTPPHNKTKKYIWVAKPKSTPITANNNTSSIQTIKANANSKADSPITTARITPAPTTSSATPTNNNNADTSAQQRDGDKDYATVLALTKRAHSLTPTQRKAQLNFHGFNLRSKNLSNLNLSYADLSDADLSGATLHNTNLNFTNLTNTLFIRAQLSRSGSGSMYHAHLENTNFSNATLSMITFCGEPVGSEDNTTTLRNVNFSEAILYLPEFNHIDGHNLNFSRATIDGGIFRNCSINQSIFDNAHITGAIKATSFNNSNINTAYLDDILLYSDCSFTPEKNNLLNQRPKINDHIQIVNPSSTTSDNPDKKTASSTAVSTATSAATASTVRLNSSFLEFFRTSTRAAVGTGGTIITPRPIITTTYSSSGITTTSSAPSLQLHQPTEIKPPSKEDAKLATTTQHNTSAQTVTAPNTPFTATRATDEKKQPSYFPCTLPDGKMPWLNTTGLDNPGVACYASSVMQCLFAIDPLMINIMRMETKDPVITGFKQLVAQKITQSDTDEKTGNKTASHKYPTDLYNNINLQFFNGNATSPQPVRQQDAQEFYVKLIEALGDTGNLFRSTASSSITCSVCHHKKVTQETLIVDQKEHNPSCINLAVPSKVTCSSLRTLLDDYFKTETLDGANAYNCPQCKNSTKASKRLLIDQLPAVLTIHLSRFDMQHGFFKNLTPVTFPLGLTIKNEYLTQPTQTPIGYTLVGVVIHHGWFRTDGHYIAVTKNAGNQTWYECDDKSIKCPQQEAIAQFASLGYWQGDFLADPKTTTWQRGIYTPTLLFYVRNDVMSKYGNGISEPTPEEKDVKQALPPLVLTQELAQALNAAFAGTQATQTYTGNAQSDLYINQQLYMLLIDAIQTGRVADVKMLLAGLINNIYTNNNLYVDLVTQTHLTVQQRLRNLQAIFKLLPPATATTATIDKKIWDEMVAAITAADVSNTTRLMTSFTTRLATHDGKKTLEAHFVETYRAAKEQLLNMDQIAQLFQSLA